jgi:hypothetical protein
LESERRLFYSLISKTRFMTHANSIEPSAIQRWMRDNLDASGVEKELTGQGHDAEFIARAIEAFRKEKHLKRLSNGFVLLGIGAVIGFLGCVLAITNPFPNLYSLSLYGSTCLAMVLIGVGMYYVLE